MPLILSLSSLDCARDDPEDVEGSRMSRVTRSRAYGTVNALKT